MSIEFVVFCVENSRVQAGQKRPVHSRIFGLGRDVFRLVLPVSTYYNYITPRKPLPMISLELTMVIKLRESFSRRKLRSCRA